MTTPHAESGDIIDVDPPDDAPADSNATVLLKTPSLTVLRLVVRADPALAPVRVAVTR